MPRSDIQLLIDAIQDNTPNTALELRTVLTAMNLGLMQPYEVMELDVPNTFITANFDPTGLGFGNYLGTAICNGNNGTRDRGGKVSIGYSLTYATLGATGGSETHTLTPSQIPPLPGIPQGTADLDRGTQPSSFSIHGTPVTFGGGQPHNNMQPYIVSLFIMKLP